MARDVSSALAEITSRYGIPAEVPAPRPVPRQVTHGTPCEIVLAQIAAGAGASIPQGLLDLAGLTRDGRDAADELLRRATVAAGVPSEFRDVPPDRSRNDRFAPERHRGVWAYGDVGRSKTRTACAWLRGWLLDNPGGTALFATEDSMLGEVKSAFDRRDVDAEAVLGRYVSADFLVLDDMGKARLSAWGSCRYSASSTGAGPGAGRRCSRASTAWPSGARSPRRAASRRPRRACPASSADATW